MGSHVLRVATTLPDRILVVAMVEVRPDFLQFMYLKRVRKLVIKA